MEIAIAKVVEIDKELWLIFPDAIVKSLNPKEGYLDLVVEGKIYLSRLNQT